jgi:addiction module HigA family antidote
MTEPKRNEYEPDEVSPPGATLADLLKQVGMAQAELADRMGRPRKTINEIVKGKAQLTPETALQLERVFDLPASFWNNRERIYRDFLARRSEAARLSADDGWLGELPVREMVKAGWVQSRAQVVEQVRELLNFFGVASPEQWRRLWRAPEAAFRKSPAFEAHPGAVAAWLRKGELIAQQLDCRPYDEGRLRGCLQECRALTLEPPQSFVPRLTGLCASAGVAVVFQPTLSKTPLSGATRWLSADRAMVLLSLRYKTDDQLWFTFFHEMCHVLRHRKQDVFIEGGSENGPLEDEANRFAADLLVPPREYAAFVACGRPDRVEVGAFARRIGVCPGAVVGRLQHDGKLPHRYLNGLKRRLDWRRPPPIFP